MGLFQNYFAQSAPYQAEAGAVKGLLPETVKGFNAAGGFIQQGTRRAAGALNDAYTDIFKARVGGVRASQEEATRRLSSESSAQGPSPDLVRLMVAQGDSNAASGISALHGELGGSLGLNLAELYKGEGSELAGLKRDELAMLNQAHQAAKARKLARKANKYAFMGDVIGAAGTVLGGAASAGGGAPPEV